MFKAIKENKIIAINDSGDFPCLVYDIVEEDTEHKIEDYAQYEGEFLLLEDIPAPTEEEIKQHRIAELKQLLADTDYVVIKIAEGVATKEEYADVIEQRQAWRNEIRELKNEPDSID